MLTMEKTADYVRHWVAAFESEDLDHVVALSTDDVIFHSPLVARLSHDPSEHRARQGWSLRGYVKRGFEVFDHIKFTVLDVLRGVDSIAIHLQGHHEAQVSSRCCSSRMTTLSESRTCTTRLE